MDINSLIRTLKINHGTLISTLLQGNHGIAKSAVCKQYAEKSLPALLKVDPSKVGFIDLRLSQNDVGDLKGIPHRINGTTFFAPPSWFPVHPDHVSMLDKWMKTTGETFHPLNDRPYGVILLDEFNRATREVLQCAFELVLDRSLGGIKIPDGWQVVAAVNANQDLYQVQALDPALSNRFCLVTFKPSFDEWFSWAKGEVEANRMHSAVYDYLRSHESKLDPTDEDILKNQENSQTEGEALFTRRSWTNFGKVLAQSANNGEDLLEGLGTLEAEEFVGELGKGFIGSTAVTAFINWVKTEYKTLNAKEILDKMHLPGNTTLKNLKKLVKNDRVHEMTALANDVVKELEGRPEKLEDHVCGNIATFMEVISPEVVSGMFTNMAKGDAKNAKRLQLLNDWSEKRDGKPRTVKDAQGKEVASMPIKHRVFACMSKKQATK